MNPLDDRLRRKAADRGGALPFEEFVEAALYDPHGGFYADHGRAGRRDGDFITSVESGPLFGAVLAEWLDATWRDLGQPDPFTVAEAGAGVGTLYRTVRRAKPACWSTLRWTLIERSDVLRAWHEELPGENWVSVAAFDEARHHVVVANELLDNLAFGVAELTADGWHLFDVVPPNQSDLRWSWHLSDRVPTLDLDVLVPGAPIGVQVPVTGQATAWVSERLARADRLLVFDYGEMTADLATRGRHGWLRTYQGHTRGSDPLTDPGRFDITTDIAIDQLPAPRKAIRQTDWLHENGMETLVEAARTTWEERRVIGDLQAMFARSALTEAAALSDSASLGAFWVLEW